MDDVKTMLRAVINGQSALKQGLLGEIKINRTEIKKLDKKIDGVERRLTKRIDKIGLGVAKLEDDTPTIDDHEKMDKRVSAVEQKTASM